jgi:hypothetical protein
MSALEEVLAHRSWFVPGIRIYGTAGSPSLDFVLCETINGTSHVSFGTADTGDTSQTVTFGSLTDHRGNVLPATLDTPRVLVRSRSEWPVFIVGEEADDRFVIARHPEAPAPVTADLYVIELGS